MWKNDRDGDVLVRTTEYSLPAHLDGHIELVQPTTAFHRAKRLRATFHLSPAPENPPSFAAGHKISIPGSTLTVDASCERSITVSCLKQLYNTAGYVPRAPEENAIALTGYLEEFANFADLRQFYADQVPDAVNASFHVVLIGGARRSLFSDDRFSNSYDAVFGVKVARITRVVLEWRPTWTCNLRWESRFLLRARSSRLADTRRSSQTWIHR